MLMPTLFRQNNLFDEWMKDFHSFDGLAANARNDIMKTDIRENDDCFSVEIDLPGFKKEDVSASLEDGYLTVSASKNAENDEKDKNGKYIKRERFVGNASRSFFVGESLTQEDISAKFEDGILNLTIPKKEQKKVENKSFIQIEG